ncbi:hypothetical protein BDY19DRAFT_950467 [Irpex rosettiformis]|uniref:Uncharacterized protein n=1 Tax=Irpex rosettiformis TaxID=378272 RepID=A0ACB8U2F1_9APHY|nr:hypothetical protein BDY19DRAFT_950467 [Irpex rosettiformis]
MSLKLQAKRLNPHPPPPRLPAVMARTIQNTIDISALQREITSDYVAVASVVMYIYDWLVSFDQEVKHVWTRKWTLSTWIFITNRYVTLLDMIIILIPNPYHRIVCIALIRLDSILQLFFLLVSALLTALRAYALCNQRIWVLLLVFGLGMVSFFTNMVAFIVVTIVFILVPPAPICFQHLPFSSAVGLGISLSTRVALIIADLIVLVVTWRQAAGTVREASRINVRVPLSEVLIRDGTFFFVGLLAINIYQVLSSNIDAVHQFVPIETLLTPFVDSKPLSLNYLLIDCWDYHIDLAQSSCLGSYLIYGRPMRIPNAQVTQVVGQLYRSALTSSET